MMHYRDWTAEQVRDWLIEAAETANKLPGGYGPKKQPGNSMPAVVLEKWKDAAPTTEPSRPIASSGALSRMEQVWSWINKLPHKQERDLLYDWSEAKALGRGYLARVMERNEITERTLRRAVMAVCQGIANALNRKHAIRLTMKVDGVSVIGDPVCDFSVSSKYCARAPRTPKSVRTLDAKPLNDKSPEGVESFTKHLARVNRHRRNQAKREAERRERRQREKRKRAA